MTIVSIATIMQCSLLEEYKTKRLFYSVQGALGMFFFYGLGFSFLLTSFPESVWTNNYITTYLVPSHSLWHLGVAAAIFTWLYALLGQQQLLREMGCQAFDDYIDEFDMRSYAF